MRIHIFGLTVSSSWGNGHATLWRGLIRALAAAGHHVTFWERNVPYYAQHRDLHALKGASLRLYEDWADVLAAKRDVLGADALIVTSYCPDARAAAALLEDARGLAVFYDLDTPVSLARMEAGEAVEYFPEDGLGRFDLVLSYTGGPALDALRDRLGARRAEPLYGHVDPDHHRPATSRDAFRGDLSYLGTYADDRQALVDALFLQPAARAPGKRFVLGGSGYPADFPWERNIFFVTHVPPPDHPAFFSSSRWTLNVTRRDMAAYGWCPSGRLFEAAACGAPIISDTWDGLDRFLTPGEELVIARGPDDVLAALDMADAERGRMAARARERVLAEHSSAHRAAELVALLESARARPAVAA